MEAIPDSAAQEIAVQQQKEACHQRIRLTDITGYEGFSTAKTATVCPTVWDGILCWPSALPGQQLEIPCPSYIVGFDPKEIATRLCTGDGSWFVSSHTNHTWTNYSQCYSTNTTKAIVPFPQLENSSLIAEYIPLVKTVSRVGYGLSLATLIVAFCIFTTFKKLRCPRNKLHMHLFLSFMLRAFTTLLKDALFVRGLGLPSDLTIIDGETYFLYDNMHNWKCKLLISFWQYFIMVNYSWILMEGVYLHNLIFMAVFSDSSAITLYVVLGWGLPVLFVVPWVVVRVLWEDTLCWTTNMNPNLFHLIKVPTTISVLINCMLFINIIRVILSKLLAAAPEQTGRFNVYRRWAKSTLVLMPLFGVHYIVYLTMSYVGVDLKVELTWLFIDQIFTSSQGFVVAVLYCLLNGEVRSEVAKRWRARAEIWQQRSVPLRMLRPGQSRSSIASKRYHSGHTENELGATTTLCSFAKDPDPSLPHM